MKLQKYLSLHSWSSGVLKPSWDRTIELLTELHEGQETALFFPPLTALTFSGSFPKLSTQQLMRWAVLFSIVLWLSVLGANYLNLQKQSFQPRTADAPNCKNIHGKGSLSGFCRVRFLLPASDKNHWNWIQHIFLAPHFISFQFLSHSLGFVILKDLTGTWLAERCLGVDGKLPSFSQCLRTSEDIEHAESAESGCGRGKWQRRNAGYRMENSKGQDSETVERFPGMKEGHRFLLSTERARKENTWMCECAQAYVHSSITFFCCTGAEIEWDCWPPMMGIWCSLWMTNSPI